MFAPPRLLPSGRRRILGIDPGLTCTGYGVIETDGRGRRILAFGGIRPPDGLDFFGRLDAVRRGVAEVIERHDPREMAVEEIFCHRNVRAALILGHARGAAIAAGLQAGLAPFQYTALQVKKAVTGFGRADKAQVQQMIRVLLALPEPPTPEDASDALAVALTHSFWDGRLDSRVAGAGCR